jgi:hypothetical protein
LQPEEMARPSVFTQELADYICDRIATSTDSLRKICSEDGLPDVATLVRWLHRPEHSLLRAQYARAKESQMELIGEEIVEIADESAGDIVQIENEDGTTYEKVNHENIQRSRLRVDTRKWLMSKLAVKKYGEKIQQEVTGPDGKEITAPILNIKIEK